jgi:uncharacterized SAM-binding protein YcdF (DUF218 family)
MKTWLRRLRWPLVIVGLLLAAWLTSGWWLAWLGRYLDVSEAPGQDDVVFVLGGGADTRPFVAAALVKTGHVKRVLVARVKPQPGRAPLAIQEQEVMTRVLRLRGVTDEQIVLLPDECDSTLDEAHALARYLDREPAQRVTIVTSDFHTRRARLLFSRVLGERMSRVRFVAAPTDGFNADSWWQSEDGVVTYTTEYLKLAQTLLR